MKKAVICALLVCMMVGISAAAVEMLNPPVKTTGYYKTDDGKGWDVVRFFNDADGKLRANWSCWWPAGGIYMLVSSYTWNGYDVGPGHYFEEDLWGGGFTVVALEGNPATKIRVFFSDGTTLDMTWHAGYP